MTRREELHPWIVAMRAEGVTWREIGERVGLALSTVAEYGTDPDGTYARARKAKHAGPCVDCGSATSNGTAQRCNPCNGAHRRDQSRRWILDSFEEWNDLFGVPPTATDWNPTYARAVGMNHRAERHEQTGRPWPPASSVINIFGSWNAGRAAAGFDVFETGRCGRDGDDPGVREETVRLYRSGLSCAAVGERMGVPGKTVLTRLIAAGEPRRAVGRPRRRADIEERTP